MNRETNKEKVLALIGNTPEGLTDFEVADHLGMWLSSVNSARRTLVIEGRVRTTGEERPSGRGGNAQAWVTV